ncbi:MAG TPA: sulfatase/phosphatase domain-containing protein, partial [Pirellulales bacterium]|nr:sulfatase/phosphatase domain-containing protein [Pirellulales bacterium]
RWNGTVVFGGKGSTTDYGMRVPFIANWPGTIPPGLVSRDLVDSTDFFPTICAAAGATVPSDLTIDGHNLLPQLRGERGDPRDWIYCWYAPEGGKRPVAEFARSDRYKLYNDGRLFDVSQVDDDEHPIDASQLNSDARAARQALEQVLERFTSARPKGIVKAGKTLADTEE